MTAAKRKCSDFIYVAEDQVGALTVPLSSTKLRSRWQAKKTLRRLHPEHPAAYIVRVVQFHR